MTAGERVFGVLLRAYPASFRAAYAREMTLLFTDRRREPGAHPVRLWAEMLADVARSAPGMRMEQLLARFSTTTLTEDTMKPMALVAMLAGTYGAIGALFEFWAGGVRNGDSASLLGGGAAAIVGVLLVVAGVALLRRTGNAVVLARGAAIASLATYAIMGLTENRLSMFAMLIGIGVPLAMLVTLGRPRGRSTPSVA